MKRGPAPTPTVLKILGGNQGKRPLNRAEPKPPAELPRCPAHLDPVARKCWRRVAADLHKTGLLSKIDGDALALYCQAYSRWIDANEKIKQFGMVIFVGPTKYPTASPYIAIANAAFKQMQQLLAEFGMTPSARTRITVAPALAGGEGAGGGGVMSRKRQA